MSYENHCPSAVAQQTDEIDFALKFVVEEIEARKFVTYPGLHSY